MTRLLECWELRQFSRGGAPLKMGEFTKGQKSKTSEGLNSCQPGATAVALSLGRLEGAITCTALPRFQVRRFDNPYLHCTGNHSLSVGCSSTYWLIE
ncbi:hypothetical protein AcV7_005871 [Taiwanofungus camphoratus]|nr:hypothetical protein AcV7_005871 [Antrodia cinnamomea]